MPAERSQWWYALVPLPVLVGLQYLLLGLVKLTLVPAGANSSPSTATLLLGVAPSLVGALVAFTAPVFAVGVLLDVRSLRTHSSWTPHWGYGALAVVPVLAVYGKGFGLVSIPAAAAYLYVRGRRVDAPFGRGRQTAAAATGASDPSRSDHQSPPADSRSSTSRWWYGVVLPPALEVVGTGMAWSFREVGLFHQGASPLVVLLPAAFELLGLALVPLFAVSLYFDARAVSNSHSSPSPDPRLWGIVGLSSIVGLVLFEVTLMLPFALVYSVRRFGGQIPCKPGR